MRVKSEILLKKKKRKAALTRHLIILSKLLVLGLLSTDCATVQLLFANQEIGRRFNIPPRFGTTLKKGGKKGLASYWQMKSCGEKPVAKCVGRTYTENHKLN